MSFSEQLKGLFTPVIVKVREAGYVPEGMTVRMRINETLFTADCTSREMLESARRDPSVISAEVGS